MGVYWIPDTAVALPPTAPNDRPKHPRRPFLVVSNDMDNIDPKWTTVLGFPLSTSDEWATKYDVRIAAGTANLPEKCWVRINMIQPIAKTKLQERTGQLSASLYEECISQLFRYMGEI